MANPFFALYILGESTLGYYVLGELTKVAKKLTQ